MKTRLVYWITGLLDDWFTNNQQLNGYDTDEPTFLCICDNDRYCFIFQKKSRKKMCCLVVILLVVIAVVAIIVVIAVKA